MSWKAHHQESERIAWEADAAKRDGKDVLAQTLYRRAAEEERKALADLDPTKRRTFGITTVGIASLYFQGNLLDEAEQAACEFITSDLNSDFGRNELRTLLASIYALREYDPVYAEEEPGQINVSVIGGHIERGSAPAHLINQTIKTFDAFLYRTVEHLQKRPFRTSSHASRELREQYTPWVRQLAPGSFRFAVGLHASPQGRLLGNSILQPDVVSDTLLSIVSMATENTTDSLERMVSSEPYLMKFLRLTRDLAPASTSEHERLSLRAWDERQPMTLSQETRKAVNRHIRATTKANQKPGEAETEIRGVLRGVDLEQRWLKVAEGHNIHVVRKAGDAIDDLVGSMINQHVIVLANRTQRGRLQFVDIQSDD